MESEMISTSHGDAGDSPAVSNLSEQRQPLQLPEDTTKQWSLGALRSIVNLIAQPIVAERGFNAHFKGPEVLRFVRLFRERIGMNEHAHECAQSNDCVVSAVEGRGATAVTITSLQACLDYAAQCTLGSNAPVLRADVLSALCECFIDSTLKLASSAMFCNLSTLLQRAGSDEVQGADTPAARVALHLLEQVPTSEERWILATTYEQSGGLSIDSLLTVVARVQRQVEAAPGERFPIRSMLERMDRVANEELSSR